MSQTVSKQPQPTDSPSPGDGLSGLFDDFPYPQDGPKEEEEFDDDDLEDIEGLDIPSDDFGDDDVDRLVVEVSRPRAEPALGSFQRRLEAMPQLSDSDQARLVVAVHSGITARRQLADLPAGSPVPEDLSSAISAADYASEQLVGSMYRLVLRMVREQAERRFGRERASEMMNDLLQEGCAAVVEAAGKFEPYKSPSFAAYAARVVRDRVRLVLTREQSLQPMKIPSAWTRVRRLHAVWQPKLTEEFGRPPTRQEMQNHLLVLALEWAEGKLTDEQRALSKDEQHTAKIAKLRKQGMLGAIERLDEVLRLTQQVGSLDAPMGDDGESSLGDFVQAESGEYSEETVLESVARDQMRGDVLAALSTLSERERTIVLYRYGFIDGESWTYPKIAELFEVSAERIRQIEKQVLTRLATPHGQYSALQRHLPRQFDD